MKRTIVNLLAMFGALSILFVLLQFGFNAISPSYREYAYRDFGTPEAIDSIIALYSKIENSPHAQELELVKASFLPLPQYPNIRRIPKTWLPKHLWAWGVPNMPGLGNQAYALYDEKNQFVAIEFDGSRYGGFVSKEPTRRPIDSKPCIDLLRSPST